MKMVCVQLIKEISMIVDLKLTDMDLAIRTIAELTVPDTRQHEDDEIFNAAI